VYGRISDKALHGSGAKRQIFLLSRKVGDKWTTEMLAGRTPGGLLAIQHAIADRLVFSKVRAAVGGRIRYFVSGGAPLSTEINRFFYAAGCRIYEGYGLTETSPVISVNTPARLTIGTVGPPIPGVEVRVADDG
jgi:long-chain acyl-CoA synthetase